MLLDLSVRVVKFFFCPLNVCQHVRLWLIGPIQKTFVQLCFGFAVLNLALELQNLSMQLLRLFLLLLQPVGEQQALLDASFGRRRSTRNGLDKSVADVIGSFSLNLVVFSDVHNSLVKFLFNQLVVGKALRGHGQLGFDVGYLFEVLDLLRGNFLVES